MSHRGGRSQRDLSAHNRSLVLHHLFDEPMSRAELARATGLSSPTVTRIVTHLLGTGQLVAAGTAQGATGRPSEVVAYNPSFGALVGIHICLTAVTVVVADACGVIRCRRRLDTVDPTVPVRGETALDLADRAIRLAVAEAAVLGLDIRVVTVSVPGMVDVERGIVIDSPSLDWADLELGALLAKTLSARTRSAKTLSPTGTSNELDDPTPESWERPLVIIDNEAALEAIAHRWVGQAQGLDDFVLLSLGDTVRSAVVSGGTLLRGRNGGAGSVGRLITDIELIHPLRPGDRGALERRLDEAGIVERYRNHGDRREHRSAGPTTARDVFDAAVSGDAAARDVVDDTIDHVISCLVAVSALLDPDRIVLEGPTARWLEPYGRCLIDGLRRNLRVHPELVFSKLHDKADQLGPIRAGTLALLGPARSPASPADRPDDGW